MTCRLSDSDRVPSDARLDESRPALLDETTTDGRASLPRTSLTGILGLVIVLVALLPFLPITWFTWRGYLAEVADIEREIQASNRHIALLAANRLDSQLRRLHQESKAATSTTSALPPAQRGASWELIGDDGRVVASQVAAGRVGLPCGYRALLAERSGLSAVGRWLEDHPPTVIFVKRLGEGNEALAAVLDPEALHGEMQILSRAGLDRHLYVVDGQGGLLFYSDLEVSQRGDDLRSNPPIRMLMDGGDGELRYRSVVSNKDRLGFVQRLDEADWGVIVSADVGSHLIVARDRYLPLAWSIAFALVAALAIVLWTSRRLVFPLLDIGRALRRPDRVPHAPLEVRPSSRSVAEFDGLVRAFDELSAELRTTERELVHAEKTSLMGQLASGLAHEMGTPLNIITGEAQYLLRKTADSDSARPILRRIMRQAKRITMMIRRLLDLSRPAEAQLVPLDPGAIIRRTLEIVPGIGVEIDAQVRTEAGLPPILADPKLLEHALLNLIVNACQAMPEGGVLSVTAGREEPGDTLAPEVYIRVTDTGCGIPAEHLDRVFEPFFTTKPPDQGTGLGLPIVERIIRQHGGRMELESEPGKGTAFTIFLRAKISGENRSSYSGGRSAETAARCEVKT